MHALQEACMSLLHLLKLQLGLACKKHPLCTCVQRHAPQPRMLNALSRQGCHSTCLEGLEIWQQVKGDTAELKSHSEKKSEAHQ